MYVRGLFPKKRIILPHFQHEFVLRILCFERRYHVVLTLAFAGASGGRLYRGRTVCDYIFHPG